MHCNIYYHLCDITGNFKDHLEKSLQRATRPHAMDPHFINKSLDVTEIDENSYMYVHTCYSQV